MSLSPTIPAVGRLFSWRRSRPKRQEQQQGADRQASTFLLRLNPVADRGLRSVLGQSIDRPCDHVRCDSDKTPHGGPCRFLWSTARGHDCQKTEPSPGERCQRGGDPEKFCNGLSSTHVADPFANASLAVL